MLTVIALFATTNTVLMMLVSGSRIIFGMARDGAIHSIFGNIQKNTRTPWVAMSMMNRPVPKKGYTPSEKM